MMDDLKKVVQRFKEKHITRQEFIKSVNKLVLSIPTFKGCHDQDVKHEFYAYILSRIEYIIDNYVEYSHVKFKSWFISVLYREYNNFMRKWIDKEQYANDDFMLHIQKDMIVNEDEQFTEDSLTLDFSRFSGREKEIIALKYGMPLQDIDVSKSKEVIHEKIYRKRKIEEKIINYHIKMIKLHQRLKRVECEETKRNLNLKLKRMKDYKRRLIYRLDHFSVLPTNKWVADQVGININTVGVYLRNIKQKIEQGYNRQPYISI